MGWNPRFAEGSLSELEQVALFLRLCSLFAKWRLIRFSNYSLTQEGSRICDDNPFPLLSLLENDTQVGILSLFPGHLHVYVRYTC